MKSPVVKRSIVIAGHKTSVSLEDAFWQCLKEIAGSRELTLSDLVADLRAPTPSAAAELLAPDISALRRDIASAQHRARQALQQQFAQRRRAVSDLGRRLQALGPQATLSRGYAIVEAHGHVLRDAREVSSGDALRVRLQRGQLTSTVDSVEPDA